MITAYTLAFGGLLLLGGRIADLVGRKRTFVIGLVGFAAASALGGAAALAGMLFGTRALQGVFAAVLAPSALSLLTTTFTDPKERGKAFGIYGALAGSGSAIGFIVGGLLTEYLDWRWCLYVNVPIAVIAVLGAPTCTALLNTIATTSSAAYIAAHLTDPARRALVTKEGIVHGYTVAIWWAAAIMLLAGVIAALMVTAKPPKHGAAQEAQIPESVA